MVIENVRLNKKLAHQAKEQDELFGMEFKEIAASDQGASQLRIRRVATDIVDIDKMRQGGSECTARATIDGKGQRHTNQ